MGRRGPHPAAVARTTPEARRGRTLAERFALRFPATAILLTRAVFAMPGFGLRDAALRRVFSSVFKAFSRGDWEVNTFWMDGDHYVIINADASRLLPGMKGSYRGPDGYLEGMSTSMEPWSAMSVVMERLVSLGRGRFAAYLRFGVQGSGSGLRMEQPALALLEFRRGLVVRHTYWWDAAAGSRELGLLPPQSRR